MKKKFYVTTPIYYVNDVPHIGHTCTTVIADIVARCHKLLEEDVFFLTGTDEHGAKIAEAAEKENLDPQEFCDKISQNFKEIWPKFNIEYDYFIRTTNPKHKKIVQEIIRKIYQKGDIYKAKYEGLYCIGCEKFVTESDLVDGKCPYHPNKELQKQSEENYFFKLSKYVPQIIKAIENPKDKNHYRVVPRGKKEEVLSKLKAGVSDLSISRANVPWGIPIPWDESQTIYVWVDALINYYSALKINQKEEFWPADVHIIGKEILWFHTVIWQAMLLSAGITLPKEILVHSFYTIDGQKMSKTIGNVITPEVLLEKFGVDGTRYLIASSFPLENDTDVGWEKFIERYNADLASGLGNLVARVAKLCERVGPVFREEKINFYQNHKENTGRLLDKYKFNEALAYIWDDISRLDKKIDTAKPWEKRGEALEKILKSLVGEIRQISGTLEPFIPETSEKIQEQFKGPKIQSGKPLFPRIQ